MNSEPQHLPLASSDIRSIKHSFTIEAGGSTIDSLAPIYPMLLVYSGERMAVSGQSTSWYMAASSIGSMTLPWIIGRAFVANGPASLMWIDALVVALGAVTFWIATRR